MSPTSAQHAALRILLEDVEPLLKQADEVATTLKAVHEELGADLETLGVLVQRAIDAQPALFEAGRKLNGSAARIEASMGRAGSVPSAHPARPPSWPAVLAASVGSALLSAALVTAVLCFIGGDLLEQARIGRALQSGWSSLDAGTRVKVHEAMRK
jgi:hypothetical protein